jgi:TldD protein
VQVRRDALYSSSDSESAGWMLRVFTGGQWGHAACSASDRLTADEMATRACSLAVAMARLQALPFTEAGRLSEALAPWSSPCRVDPFSIPLKEQVDFLLSLSTAHMAAKDVAYTVANLFAVKRQTLYRNTLGGRAEQTVIVTHPNTGMTMFDGVSRRIVSRSSDIEPRCTGYEITGEYPFAAESAAALEELAEMMRAQPVQEGEYDLVIDAGPLWRIVHDTLAVQVDAQSLTGVDGVNPQYKLLTSADVGRKVFDSRHLNLSYDSALAGGLASVAVDDTGRRAGRGPIIQEGVLASMIGSDDAAAEGAMHYPVYARASSWQNPPRGGMPNLVLEPVDPARGIDAMIAATEKGLLLRGREKTSLSPNRRWMQGRSQAAWRIEKGKKTAAVRDVRFSCAVQQFWSALAETGPASDAVLGGDLFPQSSNPNWELPFSIMAPPARFTAIPVAPAPKGDER